MRFIHKIASIILFQTAFLSCVDSTVDKNKTLDNVTSTNWTHMGPGGGGSTFLPTFSYASTDDFLIRCDMTGAYLTNDGGESYAQINYPNGSTSFAYDPLDKNTVYIGASTLNRSENGGKTWERIFPKQEDIINEVFMGDHANYSIKVKENSLYASIGQGIRIKNIKADPYDPGTIYFSVKEAFFYSTDKGEVWNRIELEDDIKFIYTNAQYLNDAVYLFTTNNVIKINKGTWTPNTYPIPNEMKPAFSYTGGNIKDTGDFIFYALQNNAGNDSRPDAVAKTSLWTSNDLGLTWQLSKDPTFNNLQSIAPTYKSISASENDAENVYAVSLSYKEKTQDNGLSHWYGTLKSEDQGKSWNWVWKGGGGIGQYGVRDGKDAPNLTDSWVQEAFGGEFILIIDVGVSPINSDVAVITDWYRTMKTMDGGKTWTEIYSSKQKDGSVKSRGVNVTTSYGVHFDPFDQDHIAISFTDIGYHHSYDRGKSWFRSTKGIPIEWQNTCYWMAFDPEVKDKVWSVWSGLHDFPRGKMTRNPKWKEKYYKGGVAVSVDGGKSWTPTIEGLGPDTPTTSIVLDKNSPVNNRTLYITAYGKGVYKSIDDGKTWKLHNNGIEGSLAAFELTIQDDGTLFLITSPIPQHKDEKAGREVFMGNLYKSIDGGDSWQALDLGDKVKFPNGLTFDPENPNRLYLGSWSDIHLSDLIGGSLANATGGNELMDLDGGILVSEDGGDTWKQIFDENQYVYDVTVDPYHPGRIYCNTFNQGAYRSDDYGKTWNKIKDYDFHWGHRVIIDENNTEKIFLTTFGSSVWHGSPKTK
ncbi:hypothetical protein MWU78_13685 [Arenibacter sp. F26102]|uniref:sialidase family protein n=1 Tax=Arenibacter sp. F26102 TaxID=2926416 RepID=UPI001FF5EF14|nr:sialidase family protein [Arenibacter sp. F26102]MCK0146702.1 hypothetical protein [Arenibacter sp. F26102]